MKLTAVRDCEMEQNAPNVLTLRFKNIRAGWQQWLLLSSDRHHDSVDTDNTLEKKHLDMAAERSAIILDFGDMHDVMQGTNDKRGSRDKIKAGLGEVAYFDAVIHQAVDFYGPYADLLALVGKGNHETSVAKYYGKDLTDRFAAEMRDRRKGITISGGYGGWVRMQFVVGTAHRESLNLSYHHGSGDSPQMSFGTLNIRRQASFMPTADVVVNGHTHDQYIVPLKRLQLSDKGVPYQDIQWHVRTPSYKDEYKAAEAGWTVEKGKGPKPIGCVWGRLFYEDGHVRCEFTADLK